MTPRKRAEFGSPRSGPDGPPGCCLQHYWSLSVEEQFYILWPLLLTVLLLAARRMSSRRKTILLSSSFIVVIGLSFGWAVFAVAHMPPAAYFQTTGRAWEFAVGGLAALVPAVGERGRRRLFPLVAAAWLALVLCVVLLKPTAGFPERWR